MSNLKIKKQIKKQIKIRSSSHLRLKKQPSIFSTIFPKIDKNDTTGFPPDNC